MCVLVCVCGRCEGNGPTTVVTVFLGMYMCVGKGSGKHGKYMCTSVCMYIYTCVLVRLPAGGISTYPFWMYSNTAEREGGRGGGREGGRERGR